MKKCDTWEIEPRMVTYAKEYAKIKVGVDLAKGADFTGYIDTICAGCEYCNARFEYEKLFGTSKEFEKCKGCPGLYGDWSEDNEIN